MPSPATSTAPSTERLGSKSRSNANPRGQASNLRYSQTTRSWVARYCPADREVAANPAPPSGCAANARRCRVALQATSPAMGTRRPAARTERRTAARAPR